MDMSLHTPSEYNVRLGFMECFASSVMTYIRIMGMDHRKLLLDYWNLDYQFRTLLSGKNARKFPLRQLYGVEMEFEKGDMDAVSRHIRQGSSVVLLCAASRLDYFPREYLSMESSGFQHCILLQELLPDGAYTVYDPVAHYAGPVSLAVLSHAGAYGTGGALHFFVLAKGESEHELDGKELLAFCARRNLEAYVHQTPDDSLRHAPEPGSGMDKARRAAWLEWFGRRRSGGRSLHLFAADLQESLGWPEAARIGWAKRNSLTISSIRKLRTDVWSAYSGMLGHDTRFLEEGGRRMGEISALWQRANYLLLRLISAGNQTETVRLLSGKLLELEQAEIRFLTWLNEKAGMEHE